jgi:hypothetical protein
MSAFNDPGKQGESEKPSAPVAPTQKYVPYERVSCKGCETTFYWTDKPLVACVVCTHVQTKIPGQTVGEKRTSFLNMPISTALQHDSKVPTSWVRQYIRARVVTLFEHWKKKDHLDLLSGKSGLMQLQDMCNTAKSAKELSKLLENRFIRGEHIASCFVTLHSKFTAAQWESNGWTWVHALAPRVIDIWNAHPDAKIFATNTHAYSVMHCYYQNLGQFSNEPPKTFKELFDHWDGTIERRDLMA